MTTATDLPVLELLPAVDVVNGQAVRLVQGEAGSETRYGTPLEAALNWQQQGAEWVHLVDLDAAFGRGSNAELLREVVGRLSQTAGTQRRLEDASTVPVCGVWTSYWLTSPEINPRNRLVANCERSLLVLGYAI